MSAIYSTFSQVNGDKICGDPDGDDGLADTFVCGLFQDLQLSLKEAFTRSTQYQIRKGSKGFKPTDDVPCPAPALAQCPSVDGNQIQILDNFVSANASGLAP